MCLYSYDYTAKRTRKRIVTYKSVVESDYNNCIENRCAFFSAFRNFMYEGGKLYYEPCFQKEVEYRKDSDDKEISNDLALLVAK